MLVSAVFDFGMRRFVTFVLTVETEGKVHSFDRVAAPNAPKLLLSSIRWTKVHGCLAFKEQTLTVCFPAFPARLQRTPLLNESLTSTLVSGGRANVHKLNETASVCQRRIIFARVT